MTDVTTRLLGEVAGRLKDRLPELVSRMVEVFIEVIPEFRDEAVRRLMVASTNSNVTAVFDLLQLGISLDDVNVPPAAAQYARRFAQLDMSLEALLRAYRLGEHVVLEWIIEELERHDLPSGEALLATRRIASVLNGYIDQVIEGLINIYQDERRIWEERSDSARAAQVRAVLAAEDLDLSAAEEILGVGLRGWHLAAVAWTSDGGRESDLRVVQSVLAELTGRPPLAVYLDSATLWAWLRFSAGPALDTGALAARLAGHPGLRVALGDPGTGIAGFRTSHAEALRARRVAEIGAPAKQQLFEHAQLALAGLLVDRREDLSVWVRRTLGALAADDDAAYRLRETVRTFLSLNGSYNDAAARMHVHKNTVLYRVRKAEEILGRPVTDGRLSIEVALLVCDQLALASPAGGG